MRYPIDIHQYSSDICEHKEKIMKTFRQNRLIGVLCVMMSCAFCSCSELEGLWDESETETGTSQEKIPVRQIVLLDSEIQMKIGESKTIEIKSYMPSDATELTFRWVSNAPEVATVDQDGKVTAVSKGKAKITVASGNAKAYCDVTVLAERIKYVDEYGIDHGFGVRLGEIIWAPVNCGYHAEDFPYGKLYQWGRKYGQGYNGSLYDADGNVTGEYSDATVPRMMQGGVSKVIGNQDFCDYVFWTAGSELNYDWMDSPDGTLWNSGSEMTPVKSEYDPCPDGWRVPTFAELQELIQNHSSSTTNDDGQNGYWFSGPLPCDLDVSKVFLPAAGRRYADGSASARGCCGYYWSSGANYEYGALTSYFDCGNDDVVGTNVETRAQGRSVRCVQVTD